MKKILRISVLFSFCFLAISQPSQAQFWKKIFKKEETKPKKATPKKETPSIKESKVKTKKTPEYPKSEKKAVYTIDVLLPLYLNTLVKDGKAVYKKPPDYAMGAINFYEGITIAAQALNNQHLNIQINIHDITDPANKPSVLIASHKLDTSNLILGYVQSNDVPDLAKFAKQKKINFASVLSPADGETKDNPYFLLVQPTLNTHLEELVKVALNKYPKNPKFILHVKGSGGEAEALKQIKNSLGDYKDVKEIDCSSLTFTSSFVKNFDSTKTNILFITTLDIASSEKILTAIAALPNHYRFEIFGMPSWKSLRGLSQASEYMHLSIHYTNPFYYDPTTASGRYVTTEYATLYGTEPSEMVYRGYESLYWLAHLLDQYGTIFNESLKDVSAAPFTRYEIKPAYSKDDDFLYLENKQLYMLHYQNGGYILDNQ
jgi:hypothetical protein